MNVIEEQRLQLERSGNFYRGRFQAMASPCEILIDTDDYDLAFQASEIAFAEARRIEHKYSRYRQDNIVYQINHARGVSTELDEETSLLIDYADQCYQLSEGLFDISSGILRKIWRFDGTDQIPTKEQIDALRPLLGWHKVRWQKPLLQLPPGMEIDLGGIGKEYAADRIALLLADQFPPCLVNLGGDLLALKPPACGHWRIAIQDPVAEEQQSYKYLDLVQGALTTSGDLYRFILKDGVRYSHVLNPLSGQAVVNAPRSVTVHAGSCLEAGMLSTFALLHGADAENFLQDQGVKYWAIW